MRRTPWAPMGRSERQRAGAGDGVDLDHRRVLLVAAAVGLAPRHSRPGDRAGKAAAGTCETSGATLDRRLLLHLEGGSAGPRIDPVGQAPTQIDDMDGAPGEDEIVATDL